MDRDEHATLDRIERMLWHIHGHLVELSFAITEIAESEHDMGRLAKATAKLKAKTEAVKVALESVKTP